MHAATLLAPMWTGFATGLGLIVPLGAQNAFVLRQSLRREHIGAVVLVCIVSDAILIVAGTAGLGQAVAQSRTISEIARWGGAAFLAFLAIQALVRAVKPGTLNAPSDAPPTSRRKTIATTAALTWLNPHVYIDTVLLLGSISVAQAMLVPPEFATAAPWAFTLGAIAASVIWFSTIGFGARYLTPLFARRWTWRVLDGAVALVMVAIAVRLVTHAG
ncbi:L-lysine exporter [Rarobacter faecitabidus]|uniref:L-lysine exporter family protein LysE/ArgO n=1 Tax=Rarobacter faecitabidus TaxID=13243 RepID=A0A542ZWX1_RARFA|nr:LysE/ArgO family amino acid transporter [Rarobacter faecitabidus]TQL64844.1 L-lysine exporter family protein LysE/ArgO [Rarobacter faecitabidus]